MSRDFKGFLLGNLFFAFLFIACPLTYANNLTISNVTLEDRSPSSSSVVVQFDVSWENSWRTKINHDAVWLTVRLYDPTVSPTDKRLCQMTSSGLNPTGTSVGTNTDLEIYIPTDKKGAFLQSTTFNVANIQSTNKVRLKIDYSNCNFNSNSIVYANVFGIEMVYIPKGSFYAGDNNASTASLVEGSADTDPWFISSESAIGVSNATSNGYYYVSNGNVGEETTGSTFTIPAEYPKGYGNFYVMKYEILEGQWVEFFNSLPLAQARANRDLTDSLHKNTDTVRYRNTISCSGTPLVCSTNRPARAVSYLTWMDLAAFLDWAALRPITELEFEKIARGPLLAVNGEYAWGTDILTAATALSGSSEDGTETVTNQNANAHFNNTLLSGGDSGVGVDHTRGPLRAGIFATSSSTRESAGASYYGVMDISGNVSERVVTIGNIIGRDFQGSHGDGSLTTVSGYEGNANQSNWPGLDGVVDRGVTGAIGSGLKGGGWDDELLGVRLRISDRFNAANASTTAYKSGGGRGARTYDGN